MNRSRANRHAGDSHRFAYLRCLSFVVFLRSFMGVCVLKREPEWNRDPPVRREWAEGVREGNNGEDGEEPRPESNAP